MSESYGAVLLRSFTLRFRRSMLLRRSIPATLFAVVVVCCPLASAQQADDASALVTQMERQIDLGHPDVVLERLKESQSDAGLERVRGEALYTVGRYSEADQALSSAIAQRPDDRVAVRLRGLTLFRLGRPADAIPLLQQSDGSDASAQADPFYVLALCYIDTRRYDDARHAFARQYVFAPDSASAHLLAARMLLRRSFVTIAHDEAAKSLALDPSLPLAHLLLGEVALAQEHLDEAITEFTAETDRNPMEGSAYERLAGAYIHKGDYLSAQKSLQRAVLLEPNSTGPYILLGKVFIKRGIPASATGYLERATTMDPGNYMTHSLLGQAYRMQ
jgi:predicted Zn-dependent protease